MDGVQAELRRGLPDGRAGWHRSALGLGLHVSGPLPHRRSRMGPGLGDRRLQPLRWCPPGQSHVGRPLHHRVPAAGRERWHRRRDGVRLAATAHAVAHADHRLHLGAHRRIDRGHRRRRALVSTKYRLSTGPGHVELAPLARPEHERGRPADVRRSRRHHGLRVHPHRCPVGCEHRPREDGQARGRRPRQERRRAALVQLQRGLERRPAVAARLHGHRPRSPNGRWPGSSPSASRG